MTANNDEVYIGPLETATVDVVRNDVITCNNHTLRIISYSSSMGTATLSGDFIIFHPASSVRGETVTIQYGITCNNIEKTATLSVHVSEYNRPTNLSPPNMECATSFPINVEFDVEPMFHTKDPTPKHAHQLLLYSLPIVGDLNGDLKPEILSVGLSSHSGRVTANAQYITILDGQTGKTLVEYDAGFEFVVSSNNPDESAYHSSPSYMAIADVDNDGKGEIIMAFPIGKDPSNAAHEYSEQVV
ncbi:MAG: hypothetical protein LBD91_06225, partial [Prevotellaceae bacterium]|nr:hypothetical protein [Prevotellaceae bacterium]